MRPLAAPTKPSLVFIHGFLGSPDEWRGVVDALAERFSCLLLTLPECDHQGQPLRTWDTLIAACERRWSALLPARFTLVGYSLGGRIAQALCQNWLDRLEAVVLEGAHPGLTTELERRQRLQQDHQWSHCLRTTPLTEALVLWYRQPVFAGLSAQQRADLVKLRSGLDGERMADLLLAASLAGQPDYWTALAQLPVPLLYISGALDTKFCALAEQLAKHRPGLDRQQLPDSGHNCHHNAPKPYAALLAHFLTQVSHD
ncbi:2-succinyl-6-hydroxy-2,4-cyclohexadiene-1-carboxylate synthase [Reinekea sp.]|jgi:2-succinyl-6-hydroxy-2,4-cyclohexadiene-1-carboxylate synthase|uniref:2-succinyl-6-hydroxy-2, 4-cyclohexadiene-1-carboxylate synthase n=1 Tax=Reinekea sp. TaxID=1970455 RepID=UPI002A816447|nr:2-succinyl-6-hydroxy-2,4-cyclohexadiene-1-carboxylate synthase [Reinekea sp.]